MNEVIEIVIGVSALVLLLVISLVAAHKEYKLLKQKADKEIEERQVIIDYIKSKMEDSYDTI